MRLEGGARKVHLPHLGDAIVVAIEEPSTAALHYPNVRGVGRTLTLRAANAGSGAATVRARLGSATGPILATCWLPPSSGAFVDVACPFSHGAEVVSVALTFEGQLQIDALRLA